MNAQRPAFVAPVYCPRCQAEIDRLLRLIDGLIDENGRLWDAARAARKAAKP